MLALMYAVTQRLFPVPFEWGRLARIVGLAAAIVAAGELLLPTDGAVGLISRLAVWLAFPPALWFCGFLEPNERRVLRELLRPGAVLQRLRAIRTLPRRHGRGRGGARGARPALTPEVYEAERRDEDASL